jgi:hypothetical protein
MKKSISALIILILTLGCNFEVIQVKTEVWKTVNYIDSVQILLTNDYHLSESYGFGASSFLIKAKGDTVLCTAKHLLGEAMGISPEVKTDSFNASFNYWIAYPRHNRLSDDTIVCTQLITEIVTDVDIILQECELGVKNDIVALTPRFSRAIAGERFEIIGCVYSDSACHQRKFYATLDSFEDGQLFLLSESDFDASGFSGAPVIDSSGFVIGLLSGGAEFGGEFYLVIEPLTKIKTYLE